MPESPHLSAFAPFRQSDFARLFLVTAAATLGSRALAVVLGYQVYELTGDPLALGALGLVEAIPSISLALFGGHVADRYDRRAILRVTLGLSMVCAAVFAGLESFGTGTLQLIVLYALVFIAGIARGFAGPASAALEAQVVPWELLVHSSVLMASCWLSAAVIGPLVGGVVYKLFGPTVTYGGIAVLYAIAWETVRHMAPRPVERTHHDESIWESVAVGVRYVVHDQVLLGSMALDLFAVLFGGAIALLPVFASDILHVDTVGLGILNAAPTTGALLTMLWAMRRPPVTHAGRNLLVAVAGFGVAMIVFALSTSFWLSVVALFVSGVCDGVSVVIRRSILRLLSPDHLRGRIASVSLIFIGSSNELGALESGVAARYLGTVPSVWIGAIVTLAVVAVTAVFTPDLRRLSLDPQRAARRDAEMDREIDEKTEV
ncbi:MAG TPA: MFS transporter [Pirellulales bacterium]|nr:MFS transporter [Pirellulales bacterium]